MYPVDFHNFMCHTNRCAKGVLNSNLNQAVIDNISIFHKIAQNFTYSEKINGKFKSIIEEI